MFQFEPIHQVLLVFLCVFLFVCLTVSRAPSPLSDLVSTSLAWSLQTWLLCLQFSFQYRLPLFLNYFSALKA